VAGQAAVPVIVASREQILDRESYDNATSFNLDDWGNGDGEAASTARPASTAMSWPTSPIADRPPAWNPHVGVECLSSRSRWRLPPRATRVVCVGVILAVLW
jgi:hypothetical protein